MVKSENRTFFRRHWDKQKQQRDTARNRGKVQVTRVSGRIQVVAPASEEFREKAMELGGFWRPRSRVWTIPGYTREQCLAVAELIGLIYGMHHVPEWLTAKPCRECGEPVMIARNTLCITCDRAKKTQRLAEQ